MAVFFAGILIVVGLVSAVAVAVAVPVLFGLMAYDVAESRKNAVVAPKDAPLRIAVERGVARAFVIAGGAFWSVAMFMGLTSGGYTGAVMLGAFVPLVAVAATLIIGWYYERAAAVLLVAASFAVLAWGVVYQFEVGVWLIMTFALLGPMLTAAVLFWMARTEQEQFEFAMAASPQLAPIFSARSTIS